MNIKLRFTTAVMVTALGLLGLRVPAADAQTPPATSSQEKLEEVVITGSRISRQNSETASPVQIITSADLEKSGQQNLSNILRSISAEGQGTLPTSFTAGFASGASSVSLRGLGVNATLVLVNGRRMAPYGLADDGTRIFTDLNSLPLEAVDRVEVLKDGASALYGSDAIAGVVNVLLKNTVEGGNLTADLGTSYATDGSTRRIAGSYGFGNLTADKYNVYFTLEASSDDAINNDQRGGWLGTENLTPYGYFDDRAGSAAGGRGFFDVGLPNFQSRTPYGTVRVPGDNLFTRVNLTSCPVLSQLDGHNAAGDPTKSNICLFDQTSYNEIQPRTDRYNLFSKGTYSFSDTLQGYLELGFFDSKTAYVGTATSFDDGGPKYCNTAAGFVCAPFTTFLPSGQLDNPFPVNRNVRYRAIDFGGRNGTNDSKVTRAVLGMKGEIFGNWKWEIGGGYVESKLATTRTGFVLGDVLQAKINDGELSYQPPGIG